MANVFDGIPDRLRTFMLEQPVFFVATAPLAGDGHVNLSPKGMHGTFAVLGERQVAYPDLTGSGIETVAHLRENGRITIMFCAFDGAPRIVRLAGRGRVVVAGSSEFDALSARFPRLPGARSIIVVDLDRIADSCGYAVPRMELVEDRDDLLRWAERKGDDGLVEYRKEKNAASIDGVPGL
jgi:hypothetical protein